MAEISWRSMKIAILTVNIFEILDVLGFHFRQNKEAILGEIFMGLSLREGKVIAENKAFFLQKYHFL